jgi:hypothetical protein
MGIAVVGPEPKGTPVKDSVYSKRSQDRHFDFNMWRVGCGPTQRANGGVRSAIRGAPKRSCGGGDAVEVLDCPKGEACVEKKRRQGTNRTK